MKDRGDYISLFFCVIYDIFKKIKINQAVYIVHTEYNVYTVYKEYIERS
jgi:energy-converting hydrogenase A subunit M